MTVPQRQNDFRNTDQEVWDDRETLQHDLRQIFGFLEERMPIASRLSSELRDRIMGDHESHKSDAAFVRTLVNRSQEKVVEIPALRGLFDDLSRGMLSYASVISGRMTESGLIKDLCVSITSLCEQLGAKEPHPIPVRPGVAFTREDEVAFFGLS